MANDSTTFNLPMTFHIDAKPFLAFDDPQDEDDEKQESTAGVIVKVEAGPLLSTLTIDLTKVTDEVLETYAECYSVFKPGNLNFEFADQAGDLWVAQCPIRGADFYNRVFDGVEVHFWEKARQTLKKEFKTGRFLRLEPWSCGHLEDEYRLKMVTVHDQEYELSTRDAYPTLELAWSDTRKVFVIKQIGWQTEDMEEIEPIYFELSCDELFPLQARYEGVTFHALKGKKGVPQPNVTVTIEKTI